MAIEINTDRRSRRRAPYRRWRFDPRLLTLEQAATYLGITTEALKTKVHIGKVPSVEIDKRLKFDRHDLDRIITDHKRIA